MTTGEAHADFEGFSEMKFGRSKDAVGSHKYAQHKSTEILCLGYSLDDDAPRVWVPPPAAVATDLIGESWIDCHPRGPQDLFDAIASGYTVHAWNAGFEMAIWLEVCVRRMGWPRVPFDSWRDTMAEAMAHALPGKLETCQKALGLAGKDSRGTHLIHKLCKPRKPSKNNPATRWTPETATEDFIALYEYCARDVEAEREIPGLLPYEMSDAELWTWQETAKMNERGWAVDLESVEKMIKVLAANEDKLNAELEVMTDGVVERASQRDRLLAWLPFHGGLELNDLTADTVEATLARDDLEPRARRALEIRQTLAKSSVKKYAAIKAKVCDDGTIKDNLTYHGASTGRDAGRGVQIQNFKRKNVTNEEDDNEKVQAAIELAVRTLRFDADPEDSLDTLEVLYGDVPTFASVMTRGMLVARPGHDLLAADLSQIENRVTLWLADDEFGIDVYRMGLDEYKTFAAEFYGVDYDDVTSAQRQHAKGIALGCCFGMGWKTYIAQAESFGQTATEAEAKKAVNGYRETYAGVVALWAGLDKAAKRTIETGLPTHYKKIRFELDPEFKFLFMRLPSGRRIAYYKPEIRSLKTPWGEFRPTVTHMGLAKSTQWVRQKVTPGRWAENAVQATARDVMMRGVRLSIEAGYIQIGRVHDEVISEVREGEGDLAEFVGFLGNPEWMPFDEMPVTAAGWRGKRYRK